MSRSVAAEPRKAGTTNTDAEVSAAASSEVPPALSVVAGYAWRLIVLAIAAGLVALSVARLWLVILPVVVALFLATVLVPIVAWLRRRGVPSLVATWVTMFGAILLVGGFSVALTAAALREIDGLNLSIGQGIDRVERWLVTGPLGLDPEPLGRIREQGGEWLFGNAGGVSGQLIGGASLVLELIAGLLLAIVLLFFFVKDGPAIWAWLVRQWPVRWGPHIDEAGRRSWTMLSGYLRGTALIALIDAILIGIALALIGVPFVLPLSMLTFLGGFLPLIGASVAGIIAALVALVSGGVVDALLVLGVIIVIQQVEGDLLAPYILGKALQLHAVAILLSVTAGAALAGIVGAFLAVPVAAIAYTVLEYTRSARRHSALSVTEPGVGAGAILIRDRSHV